jgi:hypothetical protein
MSFETNFSEVMYMQQPIWNFLGNRFVEAYVRGNIYIDFFGYKFVIGGNGWNRNRTFQKYVFPLQYFRSCLRLKT